MNPEPDVPIATDSDRAYDHIRKAILGGRFPRGFHLRERQLAEELATSRSPVRHAIARLVSEGLATIRPNGRTYVADVTIEQLEQMYDVMAMLESYSAGLAALHIEEQQLDDLDHIADELAAACQREPYSGKEILELNSRFHKAIHAASGNERLNELVLQVVDFPHTVYLKFGDPGPMHNDRSLDEHRQIVEALRRRDSAQAALWMKVHSESVRRQARDQWQRHQATNAENAPAPRRRGAAGA